MITVQYRPTVAEPGVYFYDGGKPFYSVTKIDDAWEIIARLPIAAALGGLSVDGRKVTNTTALLKETARFIAGEP